MNKEFKIRAMGKTELALCYNSHLSASGALQALRRWINFNPSLVQELEEVGYNKYSHTYRPIDVHIIVKYLGTP